jgi:AAA domain
MHEEAIPIAGGVDESLLPASPIEAVTSFNDFEHQYHDYIASESIVERQRPAVSMLELSKRPALPVTSYVPGYVYAGSLNLVAGEPKAGKSTLVWYLINAISTGTPFLDMDTRKANVLYVSEQNEVSFRQETSNIAGFSTNPNTYVLLPESCPVGDWNARINFWGERLDACNCNVLVIDTFGSFATFPPGGENDSACVSERLMSLKHLYKSRPSLAIILVHHIRKPYVDPKNPDREKAYADLRDSRGSTAIVGGIDQAVMITKDAAFDKVRNIHCEGRFEQESFSSIVLTDTGYKKADLNRRNFK